MTLSSMEGIFSPVLVSLFAVDMIASQFDKGSNGVFRAGDDMTAVET